MSKTAALFGASGLVGTQILQQLLQNNKYEKVIIFVRKSIDNQSDKLVQIITDFSDIASLSIPAHDAYCALGTTLRKAGSKENQTQIDLDLPLALAKVCKNQGVKQFMLVSSIGANAASNNFYLQLKGKLEEGIAALNFEKFVSGRPSIILGNRPEFRLGEKIGIILFKLLGPIMIGPAKKYRGIKDSDIAKALISEANAPSSGIYFIESDQLQSIANRA